MLKEKIRFPLFDTAVCIAGGALSAAGTVFNMFQTGLGANVVGSGGAYIKSKLDTNMTSNGQMPYAEMVVVGIGVTVFTRVAVPSVIADMNQIDNCMLLTFQREDRTVLELPVINFPAGKGLVAGGHATIATKGMASVTNMLRIMPERYTQTQRIQLSLTCTNAINTGADTFVAVYLEGIVTKGF
jgi:hypothetical protein